MVYQFECPVFHPTKEEITGSFEKYIESLERRIGKVGICKIVPPAGWTPRRAGYGERLDVPIPRPIRQHATGRKGVYRTILVEADPMSLRYDFRPEALSRENLPPETEERESLERRFWKNVTMSPPLYGADVEGSLFDKDMKEWNLRSLNSLLSRTLRQNKLAIPGVNTPYLYFGMWRSFFAWHTEDMDLHSVNYLHYGASKSWYCIPLEYKQRFEQLIKEQLPDLFRMCPEFFRHKELLISPFFLEQNAIPVVKVQQKAGEFIINFPGAYHAGFNHGYNCAESTNFATRSWISAGVHANVCQCSNESVSIQMTLFMDVATPKVRKLIRELCVESESDSESESESESEAEVEVTVQRGRKRVQVKPRGQRGRKRAKLDEKAPPSPTAGRSMAGRSMAGRSLPAAAQMPAKRIGRPPGSRNKVQGAPRKPRAAIKAASTPKRQPRAASSLGQPRGVIKPQRRALAVPTRRIAASASSPKPSRGRQTAAAKKAAAAANAVSTARKLAARARRVQARGVAKAAPKSAVKHGAVGSKAQAAAGVRPLADGATRVLPSRKATEGPRATLQLLSKRQLRERGLDI